MSNMQWRSCLSRESIADVIRSDDSDDDEREASKAESSERTRFELHQMVKDSLKSDDLQDKLLNRLCEIERYVLTFLGSTPCDSM